MARSMQLHDYVHVHVNVHVHMYPHGATQAPGIIEGLGLHQSYNEVLKVSTQFRFQLLDEILKCEEEGEGERGRWVKMKRERWGRGRWEGRSGRRGEELREVDMEKRQGRGEGKGGKEGWI